jgi:hypothetical protein
MPIGSEANFKASDVAKGIKNDNPVILDRTALIVGIQVGPRGSRLIGLAV